MSTGRPNWDDWGLGIALAVAERADCTRRKVGAVLLDKHNRVVSTGYNGYPSGSKGCLEGGCPRGKLTYEELPAYTEYSNCHALHAEENAALHAEPDRRRGGTMYITDKPCDNCMRLLKGLQLKRVVWPGGQEDL